MRQIATDEIEDENASISDDVLSWNSIYQLSCQFQNVRIRIRI